jgi:hypothetical protein
MTIANVLLYVALIGYVLYSKVQGQPRRRPLARAGALRGRADKLSVRDGAQFVQWGAAP